MNKILWIVALLVATLGNAEDKLTITPDTVTLVPQGTLTYLASDKSIQFEVKLNGKIVTDPGKLEFSFDPATIGSWKPADTFDAATLTLRAPDALDPGVAQVEVVVTVKGTTGSGIAGSAHAAATITVARVKSSALESRAVAGYHQAGASSADFTQDFFLDFFIMRGLGSHERVFDNKINLWGNARIASVPQQATTGNAKVLDLAQGFEQKFNDLKVNELAQSAEFQAGLELRLKLYRQGNRRRMLGAVIFGGANGVFTQPLTASQVFVVPGSNDQQNLLFKQRYPSVGGASFVAFVPPERQRFYRFYGGGIRLSTFELDKPYAPPATWTLTLGQDESITGGVFRSVVTRIDVFYPLPIGLADGRYKFLFLFATANLRLSKDPNETPLILAAGKKDDGTAIPLSDPRVAIIRSASTRDTYRLGAGIDFVNLVRSRWKHGD
jgi:hypothetical protein